MTTPINFRSISKGGKKQWREGARYEAGIVKRQNCSKNTLFFKRERLKNFLLFYWKLCFHNNCDCWVQSLKTALGNRKTSVSRIAFQQIIVSLCTPFAFFLMEFEGKAWDLNYFQDYISVCQFVNCIVQINTLVIRGILCKFAFGPYYQSILAKHFNVYSGNSRE